MTIPLLNFILFDYYYIVDISGNSYFANTLDLEKDVRKNLYLGYFKPFCILCAFYNPQSNYYNLGSLIDNYLITS